MEIFYLQVWDINLYHLAYKNLNKSIVMQRNNKEGGIINVKSKSKRNMDSNRNISR